MTLAEKVDMWIKELEDKGRQEGRQEGKEQGVHESQYQTLIRLLSKRFGPLNHELFERLNTASTEKLSMWLDRVLDAKTIDEVFVQAR